MILRSKKKLITVLVATFLSLFIVISAVVVAANMLVLAKGERIVSELDGDKRYDCILVLGAGLRADGTPSDMLRDRLTVGVELYKKGASDVLLLSGDRSGDDYDEVSAMETFCLESGVPSDAIVKDGEGYSTYESIKNLKERTEYTDVIIVTQKYHLYRALYIANKMDISATGFSADLRGYIGQGMRDVREIAARTKDVILVGLFG